MAREKNITLRSARAVVVVIDGFGIGEMPDVQHMRPEDAGANTAKHVAEKVGGLTLPVLESLGLGNIAQNVEGLSPMKKPLGSYGTSMLKHSGADTYLGHQELMGTLPKEPITQLLSTVSIELEAAITKKGHKVIHPFVGKPLLLIDDKVVVGDNLESDPGRIINLTAPLDHISFHETLAIGEIVREIVKVIRVIVLGSTGYGVHTILQHVETRPSGQIGVNSPALGVYNKNYMAKNLGYQLNVDKQIPTILTRTGYDVTLIGKVAEIVRCENAVYLPETAMNKVFANLFASLDTAKPGLIAANIQETDLAGHEGNPQKFANALQEIDRQLPELLNKLMDDDVLVITADHGNDSSVGSGKQTREIVPLLVYGKKLRQAHLGVRSTLADIAATISDIFKVSPPESGMSFYSRLLKLQ
jgi:phosphopentomutase